MSFLPFTDLGSDSTFVTRFVLIVLVVCLGLNFILNVIKWANKRKKLPPGPIGLPFVGYLPFLGAEPHKTLWKLKGKYGDIISLYFGSKYTVILNDYEVVKEVLSHQAALDRPQSLFELTPAIGFQIENGEPWVEQRRFCLTATRDLGLGRGPWEDLITDEVAAYTEFIRSKAGKPTDIGPSLALSTSSNILSLLIGRKLDKSKETELLKLSIEFAEQVFIYLGPSEPADLLPGLRKLLEFFRIRGYDKMAENIKKFSSFVKTEIARHRNSDDFQNVTDFINSYLIKMEQLSSASNIKHYFSEHMLEGNLTILFLGATDTVLSSTIWLMRLMADHQDIQAKVHREVMDVLGKDGQAKYAERERIPYTFAVMMESQRFSSIVPLGTTRVLTEDISINGYILPKGAEVISNNWGLHYDTKYWKNPEQFQPERFLTDDGKKLKQNLPSFVPFSIGRRNCPGERIAWREIIIYFTEIIKKFEIHLPDGEKANYEQINGLVSRLKPQALCYVERK